LIAEAPEFFTVGFDVQEQSITIMKDEVFFTGFSFEDFVVSEGRVILAMSGSLP